MIPGEAPRYSWSRSIDDNSQAAEEYHLLRRVDHPSLLQERFPSDATSAWIDSAPGGGFYRFRAVWLTNGPAGGPTLAMRSLPRVHAVGDVGSGVSQARSMNRTATAAQVRFTSDRCVVADYRLVEIDYSVPRGSDRLVIKSDAPAGSQCKTNHVATVGNGADALKPRSRYQVTLRLTDPTSGEVTYVAGPIIDEVGGYCFGRQATIRGTRGNDRLVGTSGPDVIVGFGGEDQISGGGGNDLICAYANNQGASVIYGGAGNDRIAAGSGNDTIRGGAGNDLILGGGGDDRLFGDAGNDLVSGGAGNDAIRGGIGDDRLHGKVGNDRLWGGPGQDRLFGGDGNDVLFGGRGWDILGGGPGQDRLNGGPGRNSLFDPDN